MAAPFDPLAHSIVSALIRNEPHESYEATDFHEALLFAIAREIGRVHHNRYQTSWDRWSDDPHIPGIGWRRYVYDCPCPEDSDGFTPRHDDACPLTRPNFAFEDVRFTWYKNPGRGMSVNQDWPPDRWLGWFNRCLTKIREFDVHIGGGGSHSIAPVPSDGDFYLAACHVLFSPALSEPPLQDELRALALAAEEGQRGISLDAKDDRRYWRHVEHKALRPRDARLVSLGVMAERHRAERDRPRASGVSHDTTPSTVGQAHETAADQSPRDDSGPKKAGC